MAIEVSEIKVGAVFIEEPSGEEVVVKDIRPVLGKGPKREIYLELPKKPGCGVWQSEKLFAAIHSKLPKLLEPPKKGLLAKLLAKFTLR